MLLDAGMPETHGFETCRRLKLQHPNIPIIFMTGLTDVEDIVKGFEAGGSDYVTKPISPDEVKARIKTHIQTPVSNRWSTKSKGKLFCNAV